MKDTVKGQLCLLINESQDRKRREIVLKTARLDPNSLNLSIVDAAAREGAATREEVRFNLLEMAGPIEVIDDCDDSDSDFSLFGDRYN